MQTKNSVLKLFLVITALALFTAWSIAPVFAQSGMGGTNRGDRGTDRGTTSDTLNQRGTQDKDGVFDRNGSDQNGSDQYGRTQDQIGQVGMNRYLVMIPDAGDNCQDVIREFSSTMPMQRDGSQTQRQGTPGTQDQTGTTGTPNRMGTDGKTQQGTTTQQGTQQAMKSNVIWQWGCETDEQTLYLFTNASSEDAALRDVPANLRSDAKVIKMSNFTGQSDQILNQHDQKSKPSQGEKRY